MSEEKSKIKVWIHALRLRTLPLSLSGIILGSFVAYYWGYWDSLIFSLAIFTTVLFQIVSNLANDLGDTLKGADNEGRIGPERAVQSGVISPKEMKFAVMLTSILSLISAFLLIYYGTENQPSEIIWFYVILAFFCVLAAITYTIGKKAYGYLGLGDLMVFIFFGLVSVLGVYPLFSEKIEFVLLLPATCIGLLSTAVLNLNNMRDRANDVLVGKRTLVVKIGATNAKFYHAFLIISSFLSMLIFVLIKLNNWFLICLFPFLLLFQHLVRVLKTKEDKEFDKELKIVSLGTFFISVIFMIVSLIIV